VSVQRLAEAKGVKLRGHGKDLLELCPFHDDRQPSLVVTPERNIWHCLGACQAGGSVIDWVMRAEGVSSSPDSVDRSARYAALISNWMGLI
jgi:DNA primase